VPKRRYLYEGLNKGIVMSGLLEHVEFLDASIKHNKGILAVFDNARTQPVTPDDILSPEAMHTCEDDTEYMNPSICGPARIKLIKHRRALEQFGPKQV
jgi:hypothetical protein